MIADGVFQKQEEEQFQGRMDIVAERIKMLLEQCQKDRDRWETIYLTRTFWQWIGRLDVAATNSLALLNKKVLWAQRFLVWTLKWNIVSIVICALLSQGFHLSEQSFSSNS